MRKNPPHFEIKEDIKGMMYIQSVTTHPISSTQMKPEQYLILDLITGKLEATMMNDNSSRSHLIFSILIETVNKQTSQRALGKLSFVDLAGSERASKAGTSAERLKEGRAINKSLSALGDVISILSSGGNIVNIRLCVPYRNNKLTMIMKDSIGGNVYIKYILYCNRQRH